jgi:hypothetical protein
MIEKLLVLALAMSSMPVSIQAQEAPPPPIIDMHLHTYAIEPGWDANDWARLWLPEGFEAPASSELLIRATIDELVRHNIVKAWATGPVEIALSWKEAAVRVNDCETAAAGI